MGGRRALMPKKIDSKFFDQTYVTEHQVLLDDLVVLIAFFFGIHTHQRNMQVVRGAHVAQRVEPHQPEVAGYQGIPEFALPDGAQVHGVGIAAALEIMQRMAVGR